MRDVDLTAYNAYRIAARAGRLCLPLDLEDLRNALAALPAPPLVLGHGNNVILVQQDYPAQQPILCMASYRPRFERHGNGFYVSAGISLRELCLAAKVEGLSGLESLWDIPSSIGGAVFMNAGAYGEDFLSRVDYVDVFDVDTDAVLRLDADALQPAYRASRFSAGDRRIVLGAQVSLVASSAVDVARAMRQIALRRRARFPYEQANAGSLFKRPATGEAASRLLDLSGCKGLRVRGAAISTLHAGFCVARADVRGADVLELAGHCAARVQQRFGLRLELEQVAL